MNKVKDSFRVGLSFGLTSGIITVLGLLVGLHSGTHSKAVVLGGVLIIAIADSLSDAMGIHISEESKKENRQREIWESTVVTFLTKFFVSIVFIVPVIFLDLQLAVITCVLMGFTLLGIFSFLIVDKEKMNPWTAVFEHWVIAIFVITSTYYIGNFISLIFN